jgi:hypothetical protein
MTGQFIKTGYTNTIYTTTFYFIFYLVDLSTNKI